MKNIFIIFTLLFNFQNLWTQTLKGLVKAENEALFGANIYLLPSFQGTTSLADGSFEITPKNPEDSLLVVSFAGFESDTFPLKGLQNELIVQLKKNKKLETVDVVGERNAYEHSTKTINTEIITEKALLKAACCNLSESFETSGTADVSFSDAVTGAKQIRLLGLDGKYIAMTTENIPNLRGLANMYGLGYISGTMIESIQISKGVGSVVNGYESMAGQINIEYKKFNKSEPLFVNAYANSMGRVEANINSTFKLSNRLTNTLLTHANYFKTPHDANHDGFLDLPFQRQINILNKLKYQGEKFEFLLGAKALIESRQGGQTHFYHTPNGNNFYGIDFNTKRGEIFGKFAFVWPSKPYKSFGLISNFTFHEQNGNYGKRLYAGTQKNGYINGIYESIFDNTNHKFRTGFSFMYDDYREYVNDTLLNRLEWVPGAFFEYTFNHNEHFTLIAGLRNDYHNIAGNQITPRLHVKWEMIEGLILRASGGRGFRYANLFAENSSVFISSRKIIIENNLKPEITWNVGGGIGYEFVLLGNEARLGIDFYRTQFENMIVNDMDTYNLIRFSNLSGTAYSNSGQLEFSFIPFEKFKVRFVGKINDVKSTFVNGPERVPFVPFYKGLINLEYTTRNKQPWSFDFTIQLNGPSRIPLTYNPDNGTQNPTESPVFPVLYAQISKKIKNWDIYLGGENLTNYRQFNPIIDPMNPFGTKFDASQVWGPIFGVMVYGGVRFKLLK